MNQRAKAVFYRQMSVMLTAGIPMNRAVDHLASSGANPAARQAAARISESVRKGEPFAHAVKQAFGARLTGFEQAAIVAGETSGTLPECCRRLADYFDFVCLTRSRLISGMFYPGLLLHAGIVIPAVPSLILRGCSSFVAQILPAFAFIYGAVAAVFVFRQSAGLTRVREWWDVVVLDVPVLGGFVRAVDLSGFLYALSSLYGAGVPIVEAFRLAADAAGNTLIRRRLHAVVPALRQGVSLTSAVKDSGVVPQIVCDMFLTGEESGRLDETLERAASYLQQEVETTTQRVVAVVPTIVYLLVAAYVAVVVITFWSGYFGQIGSLLND